jgi:hypothetical protein
MKKSATAVALLLTALLATGTLLATMTNQKAFNETYPDSKAKLGKCSTCHVKPLPKKDDHELNPYGKDVKSTIDPKDPAKTIHLSKVEQKDSDGDGVKNIDEIKAGTNPGDKNSK